MPQLAEPGAFVGMTLAVEAAVDNNPDVICVCLPHAGATEALAIQLMQEISKVLERRQHNGKARPIAKETRTGSVMRFDFTPHVNAQEIDPERGFPAMLVALEKVVVVAAAWPRMPQRACVRIMSMYLTEATGAADRLSDSSAREQVDIVIVGQFGGLSALAMNELAASSRLELTKYNSNTMFMPAGRATSKNFGVSVPQMDEPSVVVFSTQLGCKTACSVVQHARTDTSSASPPEAGVTPQEDTPLYHNFLDTMQGTSIGQEI